MVTKDRKEYLKLYYREWRKKNKEKAKEIQARYWKKRLEKENNNNEEVSKMIDTKRNLCNTCKHSIPTCEAVNIEFGNGVGNDNVVNCDCFEVNTEVKEDGDEEIHKNS